LERLSHQLLETKLELERLRKNPKLFPSESVKHAFNHDVGLIFSGVFNIHCSQDEKDIEKGKETLHQTVAEESQDPSYAPQDERRKAWQQYLHDRAPGSGLDQSVMQDGQSNQVLTHAALRVLDGWTTGYHQIYKDIKKVKKLPSKDNLSANIFFLNINGEIY
jgi:hypothetical protein